MVIVRYLFEHLHDASVLFDIEGLEIKVPVSRLHIFYEAFKEKRAKLEDTEPKSTNNANNTTNC
jgi:hypothetical protein